MSLSHFDPLANLRAFEDAFTRVLSEPQNNRPWAPAVDIYETDHDVVLKAELPGVDPKEVECRVEDGTLYLKGERKFEKEVNEENYHRMERAYGSFLRTFPIPGSVDAEKATAEYKNGVLILTLPKKEEAKPKTIKIEAAKN